MNQELLDIAIADVSYVFRKYPAMTNKGGTEPKLFHSLRVMLNPRLTTTDERLVAIFHDGYEDMPKDFPLERIARTYGQHIADAVEIVTKRPDEKGMAGYKRFIQRVIDSGNKLAIAVKMADIEDNSSYNRLVVLPEQEQVYLRQKCDAPQGKPWGFWLVQ